MSISEFLKSVVAINLSENGPQVERTAANLLAAAMSAPPEIVPGGQPGPKGVTVRIAPGGSIDPRLEGKEEWTLVRTSPERGLELLVSHPWLLYRLAARVVEDWQGEPLERFAEGEIGQPAFGHLRPAWDSLLNNHARTAHGFDAEEHIREMARLGYTHVEVNGFAATFPAEEPAPDELLYRFYTYCPALDQFVYSKLNKGIYPYEYLQANLNKLVRSAQLAEKYGLKACILA